MKQFWVTFFGSIVGVVVGSILAFILAIFIIVGMISAATSSLNQAPTVAHADGGSVLTLDLREGRLDQPSNSPFAFAEATSMVDVVRTLEAAERDENIRGLFLRANEFGMAPAAAEELRAAISSFQDSGKFVIAHAQGFEGTSVTGYFAVAGADEIWLQDTAAFAASGLASEVMFLGGLFERFNAQPEFEQFYEYKNAANTYTETTLTEPHREATLSYMTSIYETAVDEIATDRELSSEAVNALFENAPYSAEAAQEAGLVDTLGHVVNAREAALDRAGENSDFVDLAEYALTLGSWSPGPTIALIEGQGAIVTGSGEAGAFGGSEMIGGDAMADAIEAATEDDKVRAIIIRVDSPGGSAIASDQVWNSIIRAREAGKPVIVSMATVAASGGYYIAAPADYVVAHATTITGSIGVLGGKIVLDGTFEMVGLNVETLSVGGEFATAFSSQEAWTETQREAYRTQMEHIYEDFTGRVADGRDLPLERVLEIARGRVWTGAQAQEIGLVDEIGGLRTAIAAAREIAGIAEDERINLKRFPEQLTGLEAFYALFGLSAETAESAARLNALMELPEVQAALQARQDMSQQGVQMRTTAPVPH